MMTEEAAKERWCPFARYSHDDARGNDQPSANRWFDGTANPPFHTNPEPCRCIASACMAWRPTFGIWHKTKKRFLNEGEAYLRSEGERRPDGWGYCGMAGRPE